MINAGALLWVMFSARLTLNSGWQLLNWLWLTLLLIFSVHFILLEQKNRRIAEVSRLSSISILLYSVFAVWQTHGVYSWPDKVRNFSYRYFTRLQAYRIKKFFSQMYWPFFYRSTYSEYWKMSVNGKCFHNRLSALAFYLFFLQSLASWLAVGFLFGFLVMVIRVRKDLITDKQRKDNCPDNVPRYHCRCRRFASLSMITKDTKKLFPINWTEL